MADPKASRFWLASLQSGLLDDQSLTACWDAIPPDKREVLEHLDRRLARQAVQQSFLTLWQAQQLLAGRTSGFQVDRYLLLDLIGHGGMGRVYLARDSRLNRLVALKILSPERMSNPRAIARFQREARVGAQLQHENLVRIYDFGESNGRFFLVMEYIEGKTIGALIGAQGPMPAATAACLVQQIALGLEHAHRKGLIHRDVNPYNILVTHDGIAKLADLGLAIDLAEEERVTREGATVGTFDYVAPEQARHSHAADIRSDIYSLGCTLYHMIAGQVPFPSPSLPEKLFAHQALEPTPLSQIVADVPAGLAEVVRRMMRKQPEERYPTPLHVAQALEPFVKEQRRVQDGDTGPGLSNVDESRQQSNGEPPCLFRIEAEEVSPRVLEPVPQFSGSSSSHQAQSMAAAARGQSSASPVQSPIPEGSQPGGLAPPLISPINVDDIGSGENIPLFLDLGPEPSLSESLTRPKPRPKVEAPVENISLTKLLSTDGKTRVAAVFGGIFVKQDYPWLIRLVVTVVLLICLFAIYSWVSRGDRDKRAKPTGSRRSSEGFGARAKGTQGRQSSLITVLGSDGEEVSAGDLSEAIQKAIGAKGWVVLHNHEPLVLSANDEPPPVNNNGWLKLRAAEGVHSVLKVEIKGQKPFLTIGSGMNLVVEGLEIIAHYTDQSTVQGRALAPMIKTAGPARLNSCLFALKNGSPVAGSCAIVADGANLSIENCCFQGLDTAIEVRPSGGSTAVLRQTMIIGAANRLSSSLSKRGDSLLEGYSAWGLKVQSYPGGRSSSRRLLLEHCTTASQGLLQIVGFSPGEPLQVEAHACAIRSRTLIGWELTTPETSWNPRTVIWQGEGNQLDITGPLWVTPLGKTTSGTAIQGFNRAQWQASVTERNAIAGPVQFLGQPDEHADALTLEDFAVKSTKPGKVGASPELVGPGGRRESASTGNDPAR